MNEKELDLTEEEREVEDVDFLEESAAENREESPQDRTFNRILSQLTQVRNNWSRSSSKKTTSALLAFVAIVGLEKKVRRLRKQSTTRRCWVSQDLLQRRCEELSRSSLQDGRLSDEGSYEEFFGLTKEMFAHLVRKTSPLIGKQDTVMRKCISVPEKLLATLRFLATGVTYRHLEYSTSISKAALSLFIPYACEAIYTVLKDQFLKAPSDTAEWLRISRDFEEAFQMPHCIGILGGRHVFLKPLVLSEEFKLHGKNTIELLAILDSQRRFLAVDIVVDGSVDPETIYPQSAIDQALKYNVWNLPQPVPLEGGDLPVPYFAVTSDNFPLGENTLKAFAPSERSEATGPYDSAVQRLNATFEDFFCDFTKRFAIFQTPMSVQPDKVKNIILASCALHNFCKMSKGAPPVPDGAELSEEGSGKCLHPLLPQRGYRPVDLALKIRSEVCRVVSEKT